jgi:hypothetical protein
MPDQPHSVTLAMPMYGHVAPMVAVQMMGLVLEGGRKGYLAGAVFTQGALLDEARNRLVAQAFESNPAITHIMWVDSDMLLPADAIERLLSHDKPVVGGVYHQKEAPYRPVAYDLEPYRVLDVSFADGRMRQVGGTGLGCLLVRASVYMQMSQHYNDVRWYEPSYQVGEDVHFFTRCREIGVEVWLDGSLKCGHVRDSAVTNDDWERERRAGRH